MDFSKLLGKKQYCHFKKTDSILLTCIYTYIYSSTYSVVASIQYRMVYLFCGIVFLVYFWGHFSNTPFHMTRLANFGVLDVVF